MGITAITISILCCITGQLYMMFSDTLDGRIGDAFCFITGVVVAISSFMS